MRKLITSFHSGLKIDPNLDPDQRSVSFKTL